MSNQDQNVENKLVPVFTETIFNDELKDVFFDIAENGVDAIVELDPILEGIPLIRFVLGIGKVGLKIYERNLIKQTANFVIGFNNKKIDKKKINDYKKRINKEPKKAQEEVGRIIWILNSIIDSKKSLILGTIYRHYIDEDINWNLCCDYLDTTSRLFLSDIKSLMTVYKNKGFEADNSNIHSYSRLEAIGLVGISIGWINSGNTASYINGIHIKLTPFGDGYSKILAEIEEL